MSCIYGKGVWENNIEKTAALSKATAFFFFF